MPTVTSARPSAPKTLPRSRDTVGSGEMQRSGRMFGAYEESYARVRELSGQVLVFRPNGDDVVAGRPASLQPELGSFAASICRAELQCRHAITVAWRISII